MTICIKILIKPRVKKAGAALVRTITSYILYSLSSKDSQRTLRKSRVRPVVNLSHAPKLFLMGLNSINPAETARKCLGTEGFSEISRIPRAKRQLP